MTGVAILEEVITILVGGITGIAEGVGVGLSTLATSIFLSGTGESTTISVFGTLIVVFAGIALAINLCKFVTNWLTSFGR